MQQGVALSATSVVVTIVGSVVSGREDEKIWNAGAGIILRLGARSPRGRISPCVVARGSEWSGESARFIREVVGSSIVILWCLGHSVKVGPRWHRHVRRSLRTRTEGYGIQACPA